MLLPVRELSTLFDPSVDTLLVLAGITGMLAFYLLVVWAGYRRERLHVLAAAWCLGGTTFIVGQYIQRAAPSLEVAAMGSRIQYFAILAMLPVTLAMGRAQASPFYVRGSLAIVAGLSIAWTIPLFATDTIVGPDSFRRTDLLGHAHWEPIPGILQVPLLAYFVIASAYSVATLARPSEKSEFESKTTVRFLAFVFAPLAINDVLFVAGVIRSVELVNLSFAMAGVAMAVALTRRYARLNRAREAVERSEASFRAMIEGSVDPNIVHRDGRVVFANTAAAEYLGFEDPKRLEHLPIDALFSDDARGSFTTEGGLARKWARTERIVTGRGETVHAEVTRFDVVFDGGPAVVTVLRDVTEMEKMRRQLRQADRLGSVGTLAAGVAHEVNNPMTYILTNVDLALEELKDDASHTENDDPIKRDARLREMLFEMRDGAQRVHDVVKDITTFARGQEDVVEIVDVDDVVRSSVRLTHNEIRHRAQLREHLEAEAFTRANAARLGQVMVNLLLNAAQALDADDRAENTIDVRTRVEDDSIVIEVEDNGPGIPEAIRAKIFDPFFTTKKVGEGTGLGLSICHGIVTSLGGKISLEDAPGGGTLARVVLAGTLEEAETPGSGRRTSERLPAPRRGRILVVDDDRTVALILRRVLRGYDVTMSSSGRDAIERFARSPFDLVICDVMMPDMDGIDVYRTLRSHWMDADQRFVFITGGVFTERSRRFLDGVNCRVLTKPFDKSEVLDVVERALEPKMRSTA